MKSINALLVSFSDEDADRGWIVGQLAESCDDRVVSLFLDTLGKCEDPDDIRIDILNHLVLRDDPPEVAQRFADAILHIISDDDDVVVRQHAANALRDYIRTGRVLDALEALVKNESEDIDVRHNALSAIEQNRSRRECQDALRRLVNVPDLGRYAQRSLDEMG